MKAVQKFDDAYLQQCGSMSCEEILRFVDDFRQIHGQQMQKTKFEMASTDDLKATAPSKLISMKVSEDLLRLFRAKSSLTNTPYQAQIKQLMIEWLME